MLVVEFILKFIFLASTALCTLYVHKMNDYIYIFPWYNKGLCYKFKLNYYFT